MVDPFWHKIQEAYREVMNDTNKEITVEMNGKRGVVYFSKPNLNGVVVTIVEVELEPPTLVSPQ